MTYDQHTKYKTWYTKKMTMFDNKENMIQITRDRHSSHSGPRRWEGGPAVQHEVKLYFLIKP